MAWISVLTCLVIPLVIILLARKAWLDSREKSLLRSQNPTEPWLWRRDWTSRTATDQAHRAVGVLWLVALAWTFISMPAVFLWQERASRDPLLNIVLALPAVGLIIAGVALYFTLRRQKYGLTVCRFDALPIPIGRTLRGELETRVADVPQDGFNLRLTNVRRVVTSSGKSTHVKETILWQDEQRVGAGAAMPGANGVRVPFRFDIPLEGEPADDRIPRDRVLWRLEVTADVPGIDYRALFELPVFKTSGAPEEPEDRFASPAAVAWTPPPSLTFGVSTIGAESVTIRPAARLRDWIAYAAFLAVWFGALFLIYRMGGPPLVVLFFGAIGLVVTYFAIDLLAGRSVVSADRTQLTFKRTFGGAGVISVVEIAEIAPRIGNTSGGRALYDLEARLKDGRSERIARHLATRRDAEMLAARLMRSMGR